MKRYLSILAGIVLAGCVTVGAPPPQTRDTPVTRSPIGVMSLRDFEIVVARVEPVAEAMCRARAPRLNCDFAIGIDPDASAPPNAYQTLDRSGRPVIGFTRALIAQAANRDELAFVLGHEAAHHIRGHIPKTQEQAMAGALLGTLVGALGGFDPAGVDAAQRLGAGVAARRYAKDFELQADELGTVISARAGYNPVRGAEFFNRIPDPGDRFLGTHPPNAERLATVRRTASGL